MSPTKGRPKSDNSKDTMLRVRINDDMVKKLEIASKNLNITKSDVVRNGIESEYQRSLKKYPPSTSDKRSNPTPKGIDKSILSVSFGKSSIF